jgi:hypothetical protein
MATVHEREPDRRRDLRWQDRRGGHVGDGGEELELKRRTEQSEAPTASGGHAGENERGKWGGGGVGSDVPHGGKETEQRERGAPGAAVNSMGQRTWPATAPDRRARAAALWRGQGRATGHG